MVRIYRKRSGKNLPPLRLVPVLVLGVRPYLDSYQGTAVLADLQLQVSAYTVLRKFTETWILPLPKVQVELDLSLRYNLRRVGLKPVPVPVVIPDSY